MLCRGCGAQMVRIHSTTVDGKVLTKYVCLRASCRKELIVVKGGVGESGTIEIYDDALPQ